MSKVRSAIKSFEKLRLSFVQTTVPANIEAFHADLYERIDNYNNEATEADPAKQVNEIQLKDHDKLNPTFAKFC